MNFYPPLMEGDFFGIIFNVEDFDFSRGCFWEGQICINFRGFLTRGGHGNGDA